MFCIKTNVKKKILLLKSRDYYYLETIKSYFYDCYIRKDYPEEDWFQLVGLIHDLGKIMAFYDEPQWAVVGDTFPVGCKPQVGSFTDNFSILKFG